MKFIPYSLPIAIGILLSLVLLSCAGGDIEKVKPGMAQEEVIKIMGNPSDVVPITTTDSLGNSISLVIWQFGHNQGVMIKEGKVHQVIPDIDKVLRDFQNGL